MHADGAVAQQQDGGGQLQGGGGGAVIPVPGLPGAAGQESLEDLFGDDMEIFDMDSDFDHIIYNNGAISGQEGEGQRQEGKDDGQEQQPRQATPQQVYI